MNDAVDDALGDDDDEEERYSIIFAHFVKSNSGIHQCHFEVYALS